MRQSIRELGLQIGNLPTGKNNCITDVNDVRVGHLTYKKDLPDEQKIRTGVTAILPHGNNLFREKVAGASYVINGFGKTTGLVQVEELGLLESPIMLTNTFQIGNVLQGTVDYMLKSTPEIGDITSSVNVVVGECNDSYLHTAREICVQPEDASKVIQKATTEPSEQGDIGAGTGMVCFGYKGGIGTSSRMVTNDNEEYTLGVLVLSNFGRREEFRHAQYQHPTFSEKDVPQGSIMIIVATDAPLIDRQLKRIAKRATVGLARTGSHIHNGSGDIVIAFSNGGRFEHESSKLLWDIEMLNDANPIMNLLFQATADATEEAILNSLTFSDNSEGRNGRFVERIPYNIFKNSNGL